MHSSKKRRKQKNAEHRVINISHQKVVFLGLMRNENTKAFEALLGQLLSQSFLFVAIKDEKEHFHHLLVRAWFARIQEN